MGSHLKDKLKKISEYLHLKYPPVCATFHIEELPPSEGKRFVCAGLKRAFAGEEIVLTRNNISCYGGLHWLGFENLSSGLSHILTQIEKLFKEQEVFYRWLKSVPTPPFGQFKCVKLSSQVEGKPPDLLLFAVNPHQTHRIHSALIYSTGDLVFPHYYSALCQGALTNPFVTNLPSITIPDNVAREIGGFEKDIIIFSIPYKFTEIIFDNIFLSDGSKDKTLKEIIHSWRKGS